MFGSTILDVALSLVFIYWILSLVASRAEELVAAWRTRRPKMLRACIARMLDAPLDKTPSRGSVTTLTPTTDEFFGLPSILALTENATKPPSYLDPRTFAEAVMRLLKLDRTALQTTGTLRAALREDAGASAVLRARVADLLEDSDGAPADVRQQLLAAIQGWYRQAMTHLSGRYRRDAQNRLLGIATGLVLLLNVDALLIISALSTNGQRRSDVAHNASQAADATASPTPSTRADATAARDAKSGPQRMPRSEIGHALDLAREAGLPLGWTWKENWSDVPARIPGWFISILAVSFGAPFWFDLMNKIGPSGVGGTGRGVPRRVARAACVYDTSRTGVKMAAPTKPHLHAAAGDFDLGTARVLAHAAQLAYEQNWSRALAALQEYGFVNGEAFDVEGTQGFVVATDRAVLLAFRGTEPARLKDVFTDLNFPLAPGVFGGDRVHSGFLAALAHAWEPVCRLIDVHGGATRTLWITGHSLGGALALLAAARLHHEKQLAIQGVCTFGCPRVGDEAFNRKFNTILERRVYNVVNGQDIVTRLPPYPLGYRHVGRRFRLDEAGRLVEDRGGWWTEALDMLLNLAGRDYKELATLAVGDHSMQLYRNRLDLAAG